MAINHPRLVKARWKQDGKDVWICSSSTDELSKKRFVYGLKWATGSSPKEAYSNWEKSPVQIDS